MISLSVHGEARGLELLQEGLSLFGCPEPLEEVSSIAVVPVDPPVADLGDLSCCRQHTNDVFGRPAEQFVVPFGDKPHVLVPEVVERLLHERTVVWGVAVCADRLYIGVGGQG